MSPEAVKYRQMWTYGALFVVLTIIYFLLNGAQWRGNAELHTIMEVIATLAALTVGSIALVRFYSKKDNVLLLIGVGFLGTALLDGYHTVVTSSFFNQLFPSPPPSLIPWSWNASRTFLALLMCLSWWTWRWECQLSARAQLKEVTVYLVVGTLTLISFLFFALVPLPPAYYPDLIFGRPEEFVAATIFAIALIGYLKKGHWKKDAFEHWLVLSLILGLFSQAVVMSRSYMLFDAMFDLAHLLKILSYGCVFIGLSINTFHLFRRVESVTDELLVVNETLEERIAELEEREAHIRAIVTSAIDGIITIDDHGLVTSFNPGAERMFGYSADEVLGRNIKILMPSPYRDEHDQYLRNYLDTGEKKIIGLSREAVARRKDGSIFPMEFSVSEIKVRDRQMFSGIVRDLTTRNEAQAERDKLNQKLLELSRRAGMSEVATGVLHNVGNVLNSVNVAAHLTMEKVKKSHVGDLAEAVALMDEHAEDLGQFITSDPQGRHLPEFLREVSGQLTRNRNAGLENLSALVDNVEHIKEIVSLQQSYAKVSGVMAPINLSDVVEDALKVNNTTLLRHKVEVRYDVQPLPPIITDRNKILQILVNLISNAKYALSMPDKENRLLTIRIGTSGDDRVHIEVEDNGVGIPPDNRNMIFQHGFTTKKDGHGFGLHSSALAANEMGGSLTVHSDGLEKGAVFTLELPAKFEEAVLCKT